MLEASQDERSETQMRDPPLLVKANFDKSSETWMRALFPRQRTLIRCSNIDRGDLRRERINLDQNLSYQQ